MELFMKHKRSAFRGRSGPRVLPVCFAIITLAGLADACLARLLAAEQAGSALSGDLTQARAIRIEDDWNGLSTVAPLKAHYDLQRGASGFSGKASFSAGGNRRRPKETVEEISIPGDKAEAFLKMLSDAPMKPGAYVPKIRHTDDYPSIKIQVETKNETVVFFTESQGEDHIPWGATVSGKSYVIDSDVPSKALQSLRRYLKRDVLNKLAEGVERSGAARNLR